MNYDIFTAYEIFGIYPSELEGARLLISQDFPMQQVAR